MTAISKSRPNRLLDRFRRRSISKELMISLMLLVFLFEGFLLAAVYSIQRRAEIQELQSLANNYSDNLAQVLAVPIWDFDDEQIEKIGNGYFGNRAITELCITDVSGKILFEARKEAAGENRIERHAEIVHMDQAIGRVDLYLSPDAYITDLAWLRNAIALILGASLTAILVATGLLLRVFMRRPLSILQNGIERVAQGDYDYGFEGVRHSELADIAKRFRDMAETVRDRETSLQREIEERQRAEAKIRESEAKSRALLDAIPDLMFRLDRRGTFLEYKGDEDSLMLAPEHFLGKTVEETLSPELATTIMERLEAAFRTGRIQDYEYALEMDGEQRHFESRLVAISDEQVVSIVRDITEQKKAADERERLEEKLRRAQKMEAIGMLAGGVAHDLNNVLSGLVSYPQLLLMDLPKDSPLRKAILTIQKSGEKAAEIVQDLLTLARRGVSVSEVANLNQLVDDFFESPEFEKLRSYHPNFQLKRDLDDGLLNTTGSPVHLSKTIMNLVSNGVEAMGDSGTLTLQTRNRYVDSPVKGYEDIVPGDYVVLTVADDGMGISSEDLHRVFEPFYTKKVMGRSGTGLGMAVVWSTVKDHKGYINVESEVGRGTRITVYLPASRQEIGDLPSPESLFEFKGRGETVLVVDDMSEQLEIATWMLEKLGYRVVTASGGEAAVAYLKNQRADLVVLDMIMEPGMDGLETYREILALHPDQKAVIASGYSETGRVHEAQALGAGPYIKKPYLLEKLGQVVRDELDR